MNQPATLKRRFIVRLYNARTQTEQTATVYAHTPHGAIEHSRVKPGGLQKFACRMGSKLRCMTVRESVLFWDRV